MQSKHQQLLTNINPNYQIINRFHGGMSNFTYLIKDITTDAKFSFRVAGIGASNFCNYLTEYEHIKAVENLELNSNTVFFDQQTGTKIASYIDGSTLNTIDFDYKDVVSSLKKLHSSQVSLNPYNHLERLEDYELLALNQNPEYFKIKEQFIELFETNLKQHLLYPCHCDAQQSNFILADRLYLLDWEFAAINDYIYDIASFGNNNFEDAKNLLNVYHSNPSDEMYMRLYGWRCFQCLQWHNVAMYKQQIGLGESLNIDFGLVCQKYLNLASEMLMLSIEYQKKLQV